MRNKDFAVFILTHGRPDNVITYKTLLECGYTGNIYFIVDDEDKTVNKYITNFGSERVKMFNKKHYADLVDEGNNFDERRTITHARNACFDIAEKLGITYFVQLDDDYTRFCFMTPNEDKLHNNIKDIDNVFDLILDYYKSINCKSIAISQGGDWIGGRTNSVVLKGHYPFIRRKAMNSFFCSTQRRFLFIGAMNEDVNTYTTLGSRGELFMTTDLIALNQKATQSQDGGITDMYLKYGTYCKSFTTVMMMPSSVKVSLMGTSNRRLHHKISWNKTVPKIISEKYKKSIKLF